MLMLLPLPCRRGAAHSGSSSSPLLCRLASENLKLHCTSDICLRPTAPFFLTPVLGLHPMVLGVPVLLKGELSSPSVARPSSLHCSASLFPRPLLVAHLLERMGFVPPPVQNFAELRSMALRLLIQLTLLLAPLLAPCLRPALATQSLPSGALGERHLVLRACHCMVCNAGGQCYIILIITFMILMIL